MFPRFQELFLFVPPLASLDPLLEPAVALAAVAVGLAVWALWTVVRRRRVRSPAPPAPDDSGQAQVLIPAPDPDRHPRRGWLARSDPSGAQRRRFTTAILVLLPLLAVGSAVAYVLDRTEILRSQESPVASYELHGLTRSSAAPDYAANAEPASNPLDAREGVVVPETGERLVVWSGEGQRGQPGRLLPRSLGLVVLGADGQPMEGREVRFRVARGGGELGSPSSETTRFGLAQTSWRLGNAPDSLQVRAYLPEWPESSVAFTATLVDSGSPPSSPLDAAREPLEGVAMGDERSPAEPDDGSAVGAGGVPAPATPAGSVVSAVPALPPRPVRSWAAGGVNTCRLTAAGGVACWGSGDVGERAAESIPESVAAGMFHACAIGDDDLIVCWATAGGTSAPVPGRHRLPEGEVPAEIAIGSEHACVRSTGGGVFCWGSNDRGQLGTGDGDAPDPIRLPGLDGVVQLASGWYHSCALTGTGTLYCWGANGSGQLGLGSRDDARRPRAVPGLAEVRQVTAGSAHTCAVTAAREPWCWGENRYGQLGLAAEGAEARPRPVDTGLRFASLAAGGVHTCGLTAGGRAWCWGRNLFGQLGDGSTRNSPIPTPVQSELRFLRLAGGGAHTCGETTEGELYCWGNNLQGQLGAGARENQTIPVRSTGIR